MADFFQLGWGDAKASRLFTTSLPSTPRLSPQSEERATYNAGYSAQRGTLPAWVLGLGGRYYWVVDVDGGKPVYNVTGGEVPTTKAGYHSLAELVALKGDRFDTRRFY